MKIAEIYRSRQGEGLLSGTPSVFVRTSGCNLRCWFCDTPFTSWTPEGPDLSVDEVVSQVAEWDCPHVVLTGGEPMLWSELIPLAAALRGLGRHVTIETAGTLYLPVACDLMSISPKLSNSTPSAEQGGRWRRRHERTRQAPEVMRRLMREYEYQLKFVIDQPEDCDEVQQYLGELPDADRQRVLLMPQGTDAASLNQRAAWLEPYCREHGLGFCPRRHIEWFGPVRGT
jgi:7-carboxy-7-deazaguanine synthase